MFLCLPQILLWPHLLTFTKANLFNWKWITKWTVIGTEAIISTLLSGPEHFPGSYPSLGLVVQLLFVLFCSKNCVSVSVCPITDHLSLFFFLRKAVRGGGGINKTRTWKIIQTTPLTLYFMTVGLEVQGIYLSHKRDRVNSKIGVSTHRPALH